MTLMQIFVNTLFAVPMIVMGLYHLGHFLLYGSKLGVSITDKSEEFRVKKYELARLKWAFWGLIGVFIGAFTPLNYILVVFFMFDLPVDPDGFAWHYSFIFRFIFWAVLSFIIFMLTHPFKGEKK